MEIVKIEPGEISDAMVAEICKILEEGGLVCLPCNGTYRIFVDMMNEDAVMRLFQSKRRVHKAPCLVFIDSISNLYQVTDEVATPAKKLMKELWPAPLTIRFGASKKIPRRISKELTKATGKIGVRIPQNRLSRRVVKEFGGPLLVSSANRGRKSGETSPAQVRQNFLGRVDYFVDAGDLGEKPSSTVVDVKKESIKIVRPGAITREKIDEIVHVA